MSLIVNDASIQNWAGTLIADTGNFGGATGSEENLLNYGNKLLSYNGQYLSWNKPIAPSGPYWPTTGLISHWEFNDDLVDSVGSNDFTSTGNIDYITGKTDKAWHSSGYQSAGGRLNNTGISGTISGNSSHTFAAWVKMDSGYIGGDIHFISANSTQYEFFIFLGTAGVDSNFTARRNGINSIISSIFTVDWTTWQHVAYTYDSVTGGKLYINGSGVGSNGTISSISVSTMYMNYFNNTTNSYREMASDELFMYDRKLSDAEVLQLYNM